MTEETKRTLIITLGTALTILLGIYIYTQNTGFNACVKHDIKNRLYPLKERVKEGKMEKDFYEERVTYYNDQHFSYKCADRIRR